MLLSTIVALPALIILGILKSLYRTVYRHGGWTCAFITLFFTLASGLFFWDNIVASIAWRWGLALTTGMTAGLVSLGLSEASERLFSFEKITWLAGPKDSELAGLVFLIKPIWKPILKYATILHERLDNLVNITRVFRVNPGSA